jgi:hypothetical protein
VGAESVWGKVSSLDLKWAAIRSMSVSWTRTRTCSAGRPMAVVLSVGLSPCWIARSLSGNAATGSKVVSRSRDRTPTRMVWAVPVSGAAVSMCQVPPTGSASSSGWSDVLKLLVVVSLTITLPVMAQIDIEYAGRTYTVPWTEDNVERLKGIAQHVRDGRAEVFTVLGDGFALTIVIGPTIPLTITYVD